MPRGFGLAATRRANFKTPTVQLAADHFTVETTPGFSTEETVSASDVIGDENGFSSFTVSLSVDGPFTETVDLPATTGDATLYVAANSPYRLVIPCPITIS